MRALGAIVLALTLGSAGFAIGMYRERAALLPRIECAYHEGSDDGYNTGIASACHIQEDDPRWDCRTMGNRKCGPSATPRIPETTRRSASR